VSGNYEGAESDDFTAGAREEATARIGFFSASPPDFQKKTHLFKHSYGVKPKRIVHRVNSNRKFITAILARRRCVFFQFYLIFISQTEPPLSPTTARDPWASVNLTFSMLQPGVPGEEKWRMSEPLTAS
jgi:hypothetical protein